MAKETVLVTGCAGFIGGHMVRRLLADGYAVAGVDDFSTGSRDNVATFAQDIRFTEGSVSDPAVAAEAVRGVDRVIHLASVPSVPRSVDAPRESAEASILGTVTLMDAARRAGVHRVVQASSSSVYGDSDLFPREESQPTSPMSPYAAAKLTQEVYGQVFSKCYGLDTASLR
ncbi:MAG: GDP-mannose 4,6-dehydratase, partial [Planctomycetes bacterium]|nr:GDP-mannose 4,6-dehydratase [Planctomycetota bacterium]